MFLYLRTYKNKKTDTNMLEFILLQANGATEAVTTQSSGGGWSMWIMLLLLFLVFYFFMIRPQKKKQEELQKQRSAMKKGDKIVTAGGVYGTIKEVQESTFLIEISKEVCIKIDKGSVYTCASDASQETPEPDKK